MTLTIILLLLIISYIIIFKPYNQTFTVTSDISKENIFWNGSKVWIIEQEEPKEMTVSGVEIKTTGNNNHTITYHLCGEEDPFPSLCVYETEQEVINLLKET